MKKVPIYTISNFTSNSESINAKIKFDSSHNIFKGHFPGNPIVPGVIQVQAIKDLLVQETGMDLMLSKSKNIKFLNFISPIDNKIVTVSITYQFLDDKSIKVNASILSKDVIFLKFIGIFQDRQLD